jgi:hypothetical protein
MTSEEAKKYEEQAKQIYPSDKCRSDDKYTFLFSEDARKAGLLFEKAYDAGFKPINLYKAEHLLRIATSLEESYGNGTRGRSHKDLVRVCLKGGPI